MPEPGELNAFLDARDSIRSGRREHHLPPEEYLRTDVAFCVTLCARQQGEPFRSPDLASRVVAALLRCREAAWWRVYAFCLMPDHLHAVLQLRPDPRECPSRRGLLELLGRFKSFTTRQAWKTGLHGRLWQHDQYDRLLRDDHEFTTRCRYVLENPARKGWVEDWTEWPYSGIPDEW